LRERASFAAAAVDVLSPDSSDSSDSEHPVIEDDIGQRSDGASEESDDDGDEALDEHDEVASSDSDPDDDNATLALDVNGKVDLEAAGGRSWTVMRGMTSAEAAVAAKAASAPKPTPRPRKTPAQTKTLAEAMDTSETLDAERSFPRRKQSRYYHGLRRLRLCERHAQRDLLFLIRCVRVFGFTR
jgi:hypothetical protein